MAKTLQQWLHWQENHHPVEIDLGLDRVQQVIRNLLSDFFDTQSRQFHFPFKIITIAGTNGKGSSVAMLESILFRAGYRVGSYTSPHLLCYNERIKINQQPVSDQLICQAFERIDKARKEISLSYFEFGTLAAIDIFCVSLSDKEKKPCDVVILEVGLGGRLDAVNVVDPDIALVTTVDIDHQDWLGSNRDSIALEKAGIYRKNKPALYGDIDMPGSLQKKIIEEQLDFYQFSRDYFLDSGSSSSSGSDLKQDFTDQQPLFWSWFPAHKHKNINSHKKISMPQLEGSLQLKNASNVLMILELLKQTLPVSAADINDGLSDINLMGRFQVLSDAPPIILDVAHNEQAAKNLRQSIEEFMAFKHKIESSALENSGLESSGLDSDLDSSAEKKTLHVIIGMLKDKEVSKVLSVFTDIVCSWRIIELDTPRAMPADEIKQRLLQLLQKQSQQLSQQLSQQQSHPSAANKKNINTFSHFGEAYKNFSEYNTAQSEEILLVFGSFHTITDALTVLKNKKSLNAT